MALMLAGPSNEVLSVRIWHEWGRVAWRGIRVGCCHGFRHGSGYLLSSAGMAFTG
jgi:hypothetical protein